MRIIVTGATGNVGTSTVAALRQDPAVDEVVGIARRPAEGVVPTNIVTDDLVQRFRGADAVIHLAWLIQPSRDRQLLRSVNVDGTRRVLDAVAEAGVPSFLYASSIGAYSRGPKDRGVDESWPTKGTPTSFYAVDKAQVETDLDRFEAKHPEVRVVRLRPGLIFKHDAGAEIQRLFAGPLLPRFMLRPGLIPVVPDMPRLRFQAVHSHDIGEAFRLAATNPDARGAYNVAAEPVLDSGALAKVLRARRVRIPVPVVRAAADLSWKLHLQPTPAGWLDMALNIPIMDTTRARTELGWEPRHTAEEALLELLEGMRKGAGMDTPHLRPKERT